MRAAADLEDTSEKAAVSRGRLIPARELLGDMLLESGRPAEALAEYEASQIRDPNRFRGYWGAGQAAEQAGNKDKAQQQYPTSRAGWGRRSPPRGGEGPRIHQGELKSYLSGHDPCSRR
jgi:hypothetical protein